MEKIINQLQAKELLNNLKNGTIYSVKFTKKDGTERLLNSIKGTKKGVKGVGLNYDPSSKNLIPVYDLQLKRNGVEESKCWRMVNTSTLKEVHVEKDVYKIV